MYFSYWFVSNFIIHYKLFYPLTLLMSCHFAVKERHIITGTVIHNLSSIHRPLEYHNVSCNISNLHGTPFRLNRCFNYVIQFKGFENALLLFTVFNCALSLLSHFTEDILSLNLNPFLSWSFTLCWRLLLLYRWDMFCLTAKDETHWNHFLVQQFNNSIWQTQNMNSPNDWLLRCTCTKTLALPHYLYLEPFINTSCVILVKTGQNPDKLFLFKIH